MPVPLLDGEPVIGTDGNTAGLTRWQRGPCKIEHGNRKRWCRVQMAVKARHEGGGSPVPPGSGWDRE